MIEIVDDVKQKALEAEMSPIYKRSRLDAVKAACEVGTQQISLTGWQPSGACQSAELEEREATR